MGAKWKLRELLQIVKLTLTSLTHNSCYSSTYIIDAAFEPVYWIVDHVANFMGLVWKPETLHFVPVWKLCKLRTEINISAIHLRT